MWDGKQVVSLNADNPEQGFDEREGAVYKVNEEIVGGGYQKVLADRAVQAALHLTVEEIAKIEDGRQAAGRTNDVPILSWDRIGDDEREDEERDDEGKSFHS
jgi:hypothetical protein